MNGSPEHSFIDSIAEAVAARLGSELDDRIRAAVADAMDSDRPSPTSPDGAIRGIDPHALYPVSFLAERWGYSREDTVRQIDEELLPRADWKGPTIRYRGADILRYEGMPEQDIQPRNVRPIKPPASSPAPPRSDKRVKAKLPQIPR